MSAQRKQRLAALQSAEGLASLQQILHGIEKESLRVTPEGTLSQQAHPPALGSALCHPQITTDYSEALLEFITPVHRDERDMLAQLHAIHAFTYQHLPDEERLWVSSMPCALLGSDAEIPVARYGSSNSGAMKTIYRLGLGHRYGRAMQTIAGIHYNFSLPNSFWQLLHDRDDQQTRTEEYFSLIRNFRRYFWLLLYLFGASPVVCKSFVKNRPHQLQPFGKDDHSLHTPFATSLRMGDLGYQSQAQESLIVCYNDLPAYLRTLGEAINRPHDPYRHIPCEEGNYQQLSSGLLQIENEFYSTIRPKRTVQRGQTALTALHQGGVEYIEVRCIDLDPFEPLGISASTAAFLDTFLLFCALQESPLTYNEEYRRIQENQKRMVYQGRDPRLTLFADDGERSFRGWGEELLEKMQPVAELLDSARHCHRFTDSLKQQRAKLADDSLTPSARILDTMKELDCSFFQLGQLLSQQTARHFERHAAPNDELSAMARDSLAQQQALERQQQLPFKDFLAQYFAQYHSLSSEEEA